MILILFTIRKNVNGDAENHCYFQFTVEEDTMKRGRLEGLLSYLFNVRYMYEEH